MSIRSFIDKEGRQRYTVDFYPDGRRGRRVRITLRPDIDEEKAQEIEKRMRERAGPMEPGSDLTLAELSNKYLAWYRVHRLPTSYTDVEITFRVHLNPILGKLPAAGIGPAQIGLYKEARLRAGVSNRTVNKELRNFSGLMRWALREGAIKTMPRIELLPWKRPIPLVLSFEEAERMIEAAEPMNRAFFLALFSLGLRFKEAQMLKWEDLDMGNRAVRVKQKGGTFKTLPLNDWFLGSLKEIQPKRKAGLIFRSRITGKKIWDVRRALARAAKSAGVTKRVYPHLFRHSVATHLLKMGGDIRAIQGYLGHHDLDTTVWYAQISTEVLRRMEGIIMKSVGNPPTPKSQTEPRQLPAKARK